MDVAKHRDRDRAEIFGEDAEQYNRARTSYPAALIDDLVGGERLSVLDVGCGPGTAGRLFRDRQCTVLGVEPDERMAAVAEGLGLDVEVATFEEWDPCGRRFDLIVAAQSWHWVDPDLGTLKAASCLVPGGRLALVWTIGTHEPHVERALCEQYSGIAPELTEDSGALGTVHRGGASSYVHRFKRTGLFGKTRIRPYEWQLSYSTGEWLDHLYTHSDHRRLPARTLEVVVDRVRRTVDDLGGSLNVSYVSWVVSTSRLA
jgi:SAM-dependent methyltransferase